MKKTTLLTASLAALLLVACSNEEVTTAPENAPTEQTNTSTESLTPPAEQLFNFTKFNLDVSYDGRKSYDAEYENEPSGVEAKIEDDLTNETLTGNGAYARLEPIFKSFTFNAATPNEEIMAEVLQAFNLADHFLEFDLDIEFSDGTTKEFTITK